MLRRAYDLGANRTRLPELDQEAIDIPPLPRVRFSNGVPDATRMPSTDRVVGHVDRDLSEVLMLGCDSLECSDDLLNGPRIGPKYHIFELRRFREVDQNQRRRLT